MPDSNKLELVVEVDVNKANASIKSVNTGLSSMEQSAGKAAWGESAGIDRMTASLVKVAAAGNLIAESNKKALDWAKEWTLGAAEHVAHTDKMSLSMASLAKASSREVEAVKKVGFGSAEGYVGEAPIIHQAVALKADIDAMDTAFAEDRDAKF